MTMNRVRVLWQGFPGAPGYSNHYVGSLVTAQSAIRAFYATVAPYLPNNLTLTIPASGDQVSEATGKIIGVWSGTPQTVVTATGSGNFSGSSGAIVNWRSSAIVNGRRPIGRTYLVPIIAGSYDATGTLATATLAGIQGAADALIVALAGELKVWSRPTATIAGSANAVITAQVPDMAAVLRTRRQ